MQGCFQRAELLGQVLHHRVAVPIEPAPGHLPVHSTLQGLRAAENALKQLAAAERGVHACLPQPCTYALRCKCMNKALSPLSPSGGEGACIQRFVVIAATPSRCQRKTEGLRPTWMWLWAMNGVDVPLKHTSTRRQGSVRSRSSMSCAPLYAESSFPRFVP